MSTAFGLTKIRRKDLPAGKCSASTARPSAAATSPCRSRRPRRSRSSSTSAGSCSTTGRACSRKTTTGTCWSTPTCKHLQRDNRCGIYETRPQICRDYTTDNCEYDDDWMYDFYLETPEQVGEYTEAVLPKKGKKHPQPEADPAADHCDEQVE